MKIEDDIIFSAAVFKENDVEPKIRHAKVGGLLRDLVQKK